MIEPRQDTVSYVDYDDSGLDYDYITNSNLSQFDNQSSDDLLTSYI